MILKTSAPFSYFNVVLHGHYVKINDAHIIVYASARADSLFCKQDRLTQRLRKRSHQQGCFGLRDCQEVYGKIPAETVGYFQICWDKETFVTIYINATTFLYKS